MSKVIVITGASSGIGALLARRLAERSDELMLAARRSKELGQLARSCGRNTFPFTTDVTRRQDVNRLRDEALRTFDHVDVWINNAGRGITRKVMDLTDADLDEMMAVNVKSALYGMQAIMPHFMERGKGHLINVSSFLARIPHAASRSAYNASKSALNSLTANLRMDLAAEYPDINISVVMPGAVATDFAVNALYAPADAAPVSTAQSTEEVVTAIIDLIDHPRPEIYTNPEIQLEQVKQYYSDVAAFERNMRR